MAVQVVEGSFINARKQKIYTVSYTPDSVQGVMFFHHGLGEYVTRYREVFQAISSEAKLAIFSHDYHGHGKSEPKEEKGKAYLNEFEDLVDDASQYLDIVRKDHTDVPWIMAGHSLGGLVSLHLLLKRQKEFAGLILHSAAIDVEWTPVLRCQATIGDCLAGCCPYAKLVPAVRPQDMSEDPKVVEEYLNDPEIYHGNIKARTANTILKGFTKLADPKVQAQITVPIYACHGASDRTTSLSAVKRFMSHVSSTDKTMHEVAGGHHELMWGPQKEAVLKSMIAWIEAHVGGTATAASDVQVKV